MMKNQDKRNQGRRTRVGRIWRGLIVSGVCLATFAGCHPVDNAPSSTVKGQAQAAEVTSAPPISRQPTRAVSKTPPIASETVLKKVNKAMEANREYFPKGARVQGASVGGDIVTLDFSKEMNGLSSMGESVESKAQKTILTSLQSVPGVKTARVTVEGKPFESEATDWYEPMPIHSLDNNAAPGETGSEARQ